MTYAHLEVEEYEDGAWDELIPELGFSADLVHCGCYTIWYAKPDGLETAFASAIQFLTENAERLRTLKASLRYPMRLAFSYHTLLRVNRRWLSCGATMIPPELIQIAGELGLCIELEPYFDVPPSLKNAAET
jgi:hypothetical protein